MDVSIDQEFLNLYKIKDSLHAKLNVVEKTFKKGDVKESAKCWSEMLTETRDFMNFVLESYCDISKDTGRV